MSEALVSQETLRTDLPSEWAITPEKHAAIVQAQQARSVKHGLLSSVPMICRGEACPYKEHCTPWKLGQVSVGERCVKEIGQIMEALDAYLHEFGVDPNDPGQRVDRIQIQQLIVCEVMINRCEMLLASNDLVQTLDVAFSPDGQDILQQPALHKAAEALPKFQRKHSELLQLLMATRKDKYTTQQTSGMTIDKMMKLMIERAGQVKARLAMLRTGDAVEAEKMGIDYALRENPVALPPVTIEHDPTR